MKKYFTFDEWVLLLQKIAGEKGEIVTPRSLQSATGLSPAAIKKAIQRLGKKGYLLRLAGKFYANKFALPSLEQVAMLLGRPCYISFESALEKQGIISQMPLVLTCATTKKTKNISTELGEIFWHHIRPQLFNGYFNEENILWAAPEKALLDYIYINLKVKKGVMPLDELNWSGLKKSKLRGFLRQYPESVKNLVRRHLTKLA